MIRAYSVFSSLLCFSIFSIAQSVPQPVNRPTVARASDLFEPQPELVAVGAPAEFKYKVGPKVENFLKQGLIARIFTLRPTESVPSPVGGLSDPDCDVYVSVIHRLVPAGGRNLKLETVERLDYKWLSIDSTESKAAPGKYRVVFERPLGTNANQEYFRILRKDSAEYFKSGVILTISPTNQPIEWKLLLGNYNERFSSRVDLLNEYPTKKSLVPCFAIQPQNFQALVAPESLADFEVACNIVPLISGGIEPAS